MSSNWDLWNLWQIIKNRLQDAINSDKGTFYVTTLSSNGGSMPYFVASGKSSPGTGDNCLLVGCTTGTGGTCSNNYPDYWKISCIWMGEKQTVKEEAKRANLRKDLPNVVPHEETVDQVYPEHDIDPEKGMTSAQIQEIRAKWEMNLLTPAKQTSMWVLYILQFTDFFSVLLMAGGILCFTAYSLDQSDPSNLYFGVVLILAVWTTATFSFNQQAKSNKGRHEGLVFKNMFAIASKVVPVEASSLVDAVELIPGNVAANHCRTVKYAKFTRIGKVAANSLPPERAAVHAGRRKVAGQFNCLVNVACPMPSLLHGLRKVAANSLPPLSSCQGPAAVHELRNYCPVK
eukprot:gene10266-8187_t